MNKSRVRLIRCGRDALAILALAAGYYVSGRLGLLLAIPPGYATAVWPASGIGLAGILLCGYRSWPGVWLGSFLINVWTALDTSTVDAILHSLALPSVIGAGAAAQAVLGAWLVRRFVGYTNLLAQELEVVKILLLGGPVACLLNATVGVTALWCAGLVSNGIYLFNWWTWWVGDTIGVLVFTPLVLIWAVRPYGVWLRRQLLAAGPLAAMFGIVVVIFIFTSSREQMRVFDEFQSWNKQAAQQVRNAVDGGLDSLRSLQSLFTSVPHVGRQEFNTFAQRMLDRPGANGLSWNPRVTLAERAAFERQLRQEGFPAYRITELAVTGQMVPAGQRSEYVAIAYIAPEKGNQAAYGYDVASEPQRREALERARDSGEPAATARLHVVQPKGESAGMLVFLPVYRQISPPATLAERRESLRGYMVSVFRIEGMVRASMKEIEARGVIVRLFDDAMPEDERLLYGPPSLNKDAQGGLRDSMALDVAGRPWRFEFILPASYLVAHRSWQAWSVLAGGLLFTSILGMFLMVTIGRTGNIERLVTERTAELLRANDSLVKEIALRGRLEQEAGQRAKELVEKNRELERHDTVMRNLLRELGDSEAKLRKVAADLAVSNRELEQFAYVASHDLKAPLRSISSFAQLLKRRHVDSLNGEAREFLDFIYEGVAQMQRLIDDLLQLSRVDAKYSRMAMVPTQDVVDHACHQLSADIETMGAQIHYANLPAVFGDASMLTQLFQNLIGNAIKFQPPETAKARPASAPSSALLPEVHIQAEAEQERFHFTVRDNGIGIDKQYLEQIFMVFKRLHPPDQYPGTGIGLAICKKVVQLHGGEIWAESEAGRGTTIHFTLPQIAASRGATPPS